MLLNALNRTLAGRGNGRPVAALVTRTLVDPDDPHFRAPSKPIGRFLPEAEARLMMEHGQVWQDRGAKGWRRVVASPEPREVLDAAAISALLAAGFVVVAAGGGGIPVIRDERGIRGVEAVIDKDLTAAVLGRDVGADVLVIATDVPAVSLDFGTAAERPLGTVTVDELRGFQAAGHFASGSMGPKVEAACRFVEAGGVRAAITALESIAAAAAGRAGTVVVGSEGES
jgi:carbamate kinase